MAANPPLVPMAPISSNPTRKSRLRGRVGKKAPGRLDPLAGPGTPGGGAEAPPGAYAEADRRRLCEEILADGYVQSFVDFFYLTHRPDPNAEPTPMLDGGAGREIEVPPEEMLYVRDNLKQAENARRQGDTSTVYGAYSNLAQHFQKVRGQQTTMFELVVDRAHVTTRVSRDARPIRSSTTHTNPHDDGRIIYFQVKDPKTGVYFYEKCLEISRLTGDKRGEMAANNDLGLIYQVPSTGLQHANPTRQLIRTPRHATLPPSHWSSRFAAVLQHHPTDQTCHRA